MMVSVSLERCWICPKRIAQDTAPVRQSPPVLLCRPQDTVDFTSCWA